MQLFARPGKVVNNARTILAPGLLWMQLKRERDGCRHQVGGVGLFPNYLESLKFLYEIDLAF